MDETLLMLPGPTKVAPRVLKAMSDNIVNHRSAIFGEIYTETTELMSEIFKTENKSYLLTGSGTAAMEAALSSIITPGDKILNVVGGKFGQRFQQITNMHKAESKELTIEWGDSVTPNQIKEALDEDEEIKAITLVHNETSTGVSAPIKEIGKIMDNYDALYIVDTVSSLGGDRVDVDKYGIDICVTGSQKCLAAPPGLAAITLTDDAWKVVDSVDSTSYYLDMKKYRKSGAGTPPETPYTPSVSLIYAIFEALKIIKEEGLDNRITRHETAAKATRNAVKALGLELFPKEEVSSTTVTAVKMPEGVTDPQLRGTMRNEYKVELAGGQDHLKGNIFRIGHMGNITYKELAITFSALGMTLKKLGFDIDPGVGVSAISNSYI
ncbi:pyridoxal-phosphate-dependent aminotransferase family protein [Methanobrevibacter filiformis]|uniref:Serine-pyruvate aminotransferase n=1 Tax=Methanobrevibacter filiformis TaxID=55758 RepID=A0A166E2I8_9EURY|nr:alanine--glyoxylate aminotransferase family protein [Methanobrevibacter filiformis]KZX16208.1 serine-pyruvate aminotransferase [Methanobrevibacter filiformis]